VRNFFSRFKINVPTSLLAASMFFTGACGLVSEYILCTVSTYILGNSIEQFSIIIALMLLMMGIAGYLQRFMSDNKLIEKFILIETSLALLSGFAPIAIYAAFGSMDYHFKIVQYFFIMSIGFLIGFEIPLVLRINEKFSKTLSINIANIYSLDYLGCFAGALVWTYFLLRHFPLTEISFMMAGLNFFVALLTFGYFLSKKAVSSRISTMLLVAATACVLIFGYTHNRGWSSTLEQKMYDDRIVFAETTKYQRVVITYNRPLDEHRLYINGNLQFSSTDEQIYHEQLVHPVMHLVPGHQRVLILGGGDGLALREVLKYKDVEQVTLVDLDPDMIRICSADSVVKRLNHNAFADARVHASASQGVSPDNFMQVTPQTAETTDTTRGKNIRPIYMETGKVDKNKHELVERVAYVEVFNVDADRFIGKTTGKWNVVIVDLPDPGSVELVKLYSKEFYLKIHRLLAENGMVVIQATSPYHAKESYLCIDRTLRAARFGTLLYHDNVPSFGEWGWALAWKDNIPESIVRGKVAQMETFGVETRYLTPEVFRTATVFGKGWLETESSDINTLMQPKLLDYYLHDDWKIN
jgi:spermidine synthase